jgi:flagellar biosynthesis protein FliP
MLMLELLIKLCSVIITFVLLELFPQSICFELVPSNYYVIVCITNFANAFSFFVARPVVDNSYHDIVR